MIEKHVHIDAATGLTTFLMLIPFFFLWRYFAYKNAGNKVGKAMLFING